MLAIFEPIRVDRALLKFFTVDPGVVVATLGDNAEDDVVLFCCDDSGDIANSSSKRPIAAVDVVVGMIRCT